MEKEILKLYQERIEKYDEVFRDVVHDIDNLKTPQRELTELQWSNNQLTADVAELRAEIAELHASLIKERQTHLETVAENDRLRIREHELERRVRVLANISTRYYKEQEAAVSGDAYERQEAEFTPSTDSSARPHKRQRSLGVPHDEDEMSASEFACKELEIENETLQLSIETMRIQLQEQKANYAEIIEGLSAELKSSRDDSAKEAADRARKIEDLEAELSRIKGLYRENLRDLVVARKAALESKHSVKQDSLLLRSEILTLQRRLDVEMERSRFLQSMSARAEDFSL
ncbi:Coiled-coil domain-containing protein 77 [Coemansia sp. IMI 203386]|nr:Coiled-coil domain-containing protein 77 [Coemansia sp. IMI 203386]